MSRTAPNLSSMRFGSLVALERANKGPRDVQPMWLCACDCGARKVIAAHSLTRGLSKTCGCKWRAKIKINIDLTGMRFGRLVVLERTEVIEKRQHWACVCDCGTKTVVNYQFLWRGTTKSCGCLVLDGRPRKARVHVTKKSCPDCGETKAASEFYKSRTSPDRLATYCKRCQGVRARKSCGRDYFKKWRSENKGALRAYSARRRARRLSATPVWADRKAITALYKQAKEMELATGTKFHVDHIVPLIHPKVCGLHVPANLRIVPAAVNLAKHNTWQPDYLGGL